MSKKDVTIPLREFPQSIAAEAAVLGSIISEPVCFAEVVAIVDFWKVLCFLIPALYYGILRTMRLRK